MARNYSSIASEKELAGNVSNIATQITLDNVTNLPSPPYTLVLNPDTAIEEIITVDADQSGVSAPTLKVTRAQDGTTAQTHTAGQTVKHMITGRDLQEAQNHIDATAVHGATGAVVGTTNTQTLTNKTLTSPKINENVALTATSTELNYVDGVTSSIQAQFNALEVFPKGMITPFGGSSASVPTGWFLCDGSAVSRTTYSALFAVIGTTYGTGDNTTTFNLPDLLGRVPMGAGSGTGLTARTLGTELGSESTTLTSAHIPQHDHTYNISHDHGGFDTVGGEGNHAHDLNGSSSGTNAHDHGAGSWEETAAQGIGEATAVASIISGGARAAGAHNHNIDVPNYSVGNATSGQYGTASPTAVTAVQPSTVVNFIIKH